MSWIKPFLRLCVVALALLGYVAPASASQKEISIAITEGVYREYQALIARHGGEPLRISNFSGAARATIGPIIIQQAIARGGLDVSVRFNVYPNYKRALNQVRKGRSTMMAQDIWESHADEDFYRSPLIVQRGQFKKAVYGRVTNDKLMRATSLADLHGMSALTGIGWHLDIRALEEIGVASINQVPKYDQQFPMVLGGRVDFGLLEPESQDLNSVLPEGLAIVPGLSVTLNEARHYVVSKNDPLGEETSQALNKGLRDMIKQGLIHQALTQTGFLSLSPTRP